MYTKITPNSGWTHYNVKSDISLNLTLWTTLFIPWHNIRWSPSKTHAQRPGLPASPHEVSTSPAGISYGNQETGKWHRITAYELFLAQCRIPVPNHYPMYTISCVRSLNNTIVTRKPRLHYGVRVSEDIIIISEVNRSKRVFTNNIFLSLFLKLPDELASIIFKGQLTKMPYTFWYEWSISGAYMRFMYISRCMVVNIYIVHKHIQQGSGKTPFLVCEHIFC